MADTAVPMECSNFLETFEVLVGTAPEQKLFTVHRDIATKRSGFFRAAKSGRWTQTKPTDLQEHDPDTFNRYLHCLYRNAVPEHILPPATLDKESFEQYVANVKHSADRQFEYLVDLYILADSLIDPITANMAIAKIRRFGRIKGYSPGAKVIDRVFRSTREDDGLRNLLADCHIYNLYVQYDGDFPKDFLFLVLRRFQQAKMDENVTFDEDHVQELDGNGPYTLGQYFQKLEQSPE